MGAKDLSITKITEDYIKTHPSVKDCLKRGLINYSSLSRAVCEELKLGKENFDAVLTAARRYCTKLDKEKLHGKKIMDILRSSELEIKNKMMFVVISHDVYLDTITELIGIQKEAWKNGDLFYVIEGTTTTSVLCSEKYSERINVMFDDRFLARKPGMALISLKTTEKIEGTMGVLHYLSSLFAENNVNINEYMGTWNDSMFLVNEDDLIKVVQFLRF